MNGADVNTRRAITEACLLAVDPDRHPAGSAVFSKYTCNGALNPKSMQPERIAQARFIAELDKENRQWWSESQGTATVYPRPWDVAHPGVQWEVEEQQWPNYRADVINYRPRSDINENPSTGRMELWELKTSMGYLSYELAAVDASLQALDYSFFGKEEKVKGLRPFHESLWEGLTPAEASTFGYTDSFTIEIQRCGDRTKNNRPVKTEVIHTYEVRDDPAFVGAIVAERTVRKWHCKQEDRRQREVNEYYVELPYEDKKWFEDVGPGAGEFVVSVLSAALCAKFKICAKVPGKVPAVPEVVLQSTASGTAIWQEMNVDFCDSIAVIESEQSLSSASSDACYLSPSLTSFADNGDFISLVDSLDDDVLLPMFDEIVQWIDQDGATNVSSPARITGDPHLITLDGLDYDMQSVGEFWLFGVPERDISAQVRFAPTGTQSSAVALAANWGATTVELRADGTLLANGVVFDLPPGAGIAPGSDAGGGYLFNDNGTYRLSWAAEEEGGMPIALTWQPINPELGSLGVQVPAGLGVAGLLGDNDGDPLNDLRLSTGEAVDPTDAVAIHDGFADSWRITDRDSLFTYANDDSTATFTDLSFPQEIVTLGDFTAGQQASAQQICTASNVVAGPAFRNCMLDVLVTNDSAFALAFAGAQEPSRSADDQIADASGQLTQNFSAATLPPNVSPIRLTDDPDLGRFAGPFRDGEQYRFYVPSLPRHDQVTVAFDLIATGTWETFDTVGLRLDENPVHLIDLSGATLGVTIGGEPIRTKRVEVPLSHVRDLASIALAGSALGAGQEFAVDNLSVTTRVVSTQQFTPTLAAGESKPLRVPAMPAGAGVLETWGAADSYDLTLEHQDLLLEWQTQSSSVKWSIKNSAGETIRSGLSSDGDTRLRDLDGAYELLVEAAGATPPPSESYALDLLSTPPAQTFDIELPGPVNIPADLPSPAAANGAGVLETKLSTDVYTMQVAGDDASITIAPSVCPRVSYWQRLTWTLIDAAGIERASGGCTEATVEGLDSGQYRLRIESAEESTGQYAFTLTQMGAETTLSPPPPAATNQRTLTLAFASDDASEFECALDAPSYVGPFTACTSPATFADLPDGDHTIKVRAIDEDGLRGPAVTHLVTIDTEAPNVQITRKPPVHSNINGPVFEYLANDRGMTYDCSLVPVGTAPAWESCSGASVYRDLTHGSYRFSVLGRDWVGNEGITSYDFLVDLEPPVITLTPPGNLTSTTSPLFAFTANEQVTYQCSLVPIGSPDSFTACTSPKQYSGLTDGTQYRFLVKATDVAGQWASRGVTWTPYSVPPTVTMTTKPAASSSNAAPTFAFSSNISNPTFECSLELASVAQVFSACTSPKNYTGKAPGAYKFSVKAIDPSGSWVSSTYQFSITAPSGDTQAPTTPGTPTAVIAPAGISIGADSETPASGIPLRINWTASTDNVGVSGYQLWYSTNNGAYVNAGNVSGLSVTMNVPPGTTSWRFQMRAYDQAGNTSTATAASAAVVVAIEQETATSRLVYAGTWTNATDTASSGGATRYASATSASATFKPTTGATQVAVLMATGPAAGRATITVDGGAASTVDLYAAVAGQRRIILSTASLSSTAAHTIVVKPAGTKNTSSTSTRVDLDGFVVRR